MHSFPVSFISIDSYSFMACTWLLIPDICMIIWGGKSLTKPYATWINNGISSWNAFPFSPSTAHIINVDIEHWTLNTERRCLTDEEMFIFVWINPYSVRITYWHIGTMYEEQIDYPFCGSFPNYCLYESVMCCWIFIFHSFFISRESSVQTLPMWMIFPILA